MPFAHASRCFGGVRGTRHFFFFESQTTGCVDWPTPEACRSHRSRVTCSLLTRDGAKLSSGWGCMSCPACSFCSALKSRSAGASPGIATGVAAGVTTGEVLVARWTVVRFLCSCPEGGGDMQMRIGKYSIHHVWTLFHPHADHCFFSGRLSAK